jgi:hypothetical protein
MGLRDFRGKFSRDKESEMDKWSDAGTADWLNDAPPPAFKLKLKPKPQSIARQPKPAHTEAAHQARQTQLRLRQERLRQAGLNRSAATQKAQQAPEKQAVKISIDLSLPKPKIPKVVIPWPLVRKWGIRAAIVLVVLVGSLVALRIYLTSGAPETSKDKGGATAAKETKPTYKPLAPKDKQNLASGDKSISNYDAKRKLYSYNDNYEGNQLTVSQQPLPKSFSSDPIQIRKAADSIRADEEVDTALGMVYIGFDEQANVQRMMLVYRDLLIFILSGKRMDNETIKTYVESLR